MLGDSHVSRVCCMGLLDPRDRIGQQLQAERDHYENRLRALIDALPLRKGLDRTLLRLQLLGALNWTMLWYRPGGRTPGQIAANLVALLR